MKNLFPSLALLAITSNFLMAEDAYFLGTGSWFDPDNWIFGPEVYGVPGSGTDIYVNTVGEAMVDTGFAEFHDGYINGNLLVSGLATVLKQGNTLQIGQNATGQMKVRSGALVTTPSGLSYVGYGSAAQGSVIVEGNGSQWQALSLLFVGYDGIGNLTVSDGGKVKSNQAWIGFHAGSEGVVTINGINSKYEANGIEVGLGGRGNLNVRNNAVVISSGATSIGGSAGSVGEVRIDGAGCMLDTWGLLVGHQGNGVLHVSNGGTVINNHNQTYLAAAPGAVGVMTITGQGSSLNALGSEFIVGFSGNGTLNISDGGAVAASYILLTNHGGSEGTINLEGTAGTRATLDAGYIFDSGGTSAINLNGGILRATADAPNFLWNFHSGDIQILAGGAFIDTQNHQVVIASPLQGPGGLTKLGTGSLTLSTAYSNWQGGFTYSGPTIVSEGTLITGATEISSPVTVESAGTLGGEGTFLEPVICHGTISPGASGIGNITMDAGLTLTATAKMSFELGSASDHIEISGNLELDGILDVEALDGFGAGTYTLTTYSGNLIDHGLEVSNMPQGYVGVVDTLVAGEIRLAITANFSPTDAWRHLYFGTTTPEGDASDIADPDHDGVVNLLERAFNLNPTQTGISILTADTGTAGLPLIRATDGLSGRVFSIQYLRRKASANSGLTYTPQVCSDLSGSWTTVSGTETVQSIDSEWERVTVEENASGLPKRFGRVRVESNAP